jgi:hypothetical protein
MFFREALLRCSQLHLETAALFDGLCEGPREDPRIRSWQLAGALERKRAGFLKALATLCSILEDEGPFLVQIPPQLEAFRDALEFAAWRRASCRDHSHCSCAEAVESIPRGRLHADLLELAEPELKRALRVVALEIRELRKNDASPRRAPEKQRAMACR